MGPVPTLVWWRLLRWLTIVLVLSAVAWTLWKGWLDLRQSELSWSSLRWSWLGVAVVFSFAGTVPGWLFWHVTLHQFGIPIPLSQSFRAFYLSQLGKYVPGKVMVLAIRASMAAGVQRREDALSTEGPTLSPWLIVSATSVAETLMYLAIGSSLGVLCGAALLVDHPLLLGLSLTVAGGILGTMLPPIFRLWLTRLPLFKSVADREWLAERWSWSLFLGGSLSFVMAWTLMACGLMATTAVLPGQAANLHDLPRLVTGVTLSIVIGFFSFLPGGLGVREVVLFPILAPRFSAVLVLVAFHRIVTIVAECLAALVAVTWVRTPHKR